MIMFAAASLFAATAYAQTQRTNRTKTKTHDRTEVLNPDQKNTDKVDKVPHEHDMDRNNPNKSDTNTPPANKTNRTNNGTGTNGTNTNGGTGSSGAQLNSNNPR